MEALLEQVVTILGIESSCDDTGAAVVSRSARGQPAILSNVVHGQDKLHAAFGGVVPEIAARAHVEKLTPAIERALCDADRTLDDIDAIGVTCGPGLIGGVVSGVMMAKGLSVARNLPLYGVNHLAGHALTPRLTDDVTFPYLMLLVSGGHCQFLIVRDPVTFKRVGGTVDDAPGEAFDKVARLIGLGQPGGPAIEKIAASGDPGRFAFPRPLLARPGCDMSFSGLKTSVLRARDELIGAQGGLTNQDQADLAASFQAAVVDVFAAKGARACKAMIESEGQMTAFCVAGGVAANKAVRQSLETVAEAHDTAFVAPPLGLCTDNAAMIAWAAMDQMAYREPDDVSLSARPRMPLDQNSAALLGSGRKGAKA